MRCVTYNHKYLKPLLKRDMTAVDMTMGNGNDTLFLAENVSHVYAFDIQKEALEHTAKRCIEYSNITYILDDHANISKYISHANIVLFNLGYLPYSDSNIITDPSSTVNAIRKAYDILNDGGYMSIITYRGHKGSFYEYYAIMDAIRNYSIIDTYMSHNSPTEPICYIIKK